MRLEAYKAVHGDCNVPRRWAEDPRLGKWVDHQRGRKRKLDRGEPSKGMTAERAARLTALGFLDSTSGSQPHHPMLRIRRRWSGLGGAARAAGGVQGGARRLQRAAGLGRGPAARQVGRPPARSKRKLDRGEPSEGMTAERAARLTALGFVWDPLQGGA